MACQRKSIPWPRPATADVTPDMTPVPSGSSAAETLFWMSCHFSGQSSVDSMVPMMSPLAPSALWPSVSMLMAPDCSAATNCGALRVPKRSAALLTAEAVSPALM